MPAKRLSLILALFCLLAVQCFATIPVTVFRGTTGSVRFEFKISDSLGLSDVGWFDMSIGTPGSGVCMVEWHPGNYFYLFADNGSSQLGGYLPGSNVTVSNSQCTLKMATSQATVIAGELYLIADLQFNPGFSGTKTIYAVAGGSQGHNGWQGYGQWVIGTSAIPSTSWLSPPNGGSGTDQSFQFSVTDTAGFSDIQWANFTVGVPGANSCMLGWNTGNWLSLFNDDGVGTTAGYAGSGAILSNSRCRVKLATSSASASSNTLMIAYDISFTGVSSGSQPVYAVAGSAAGNAGWSIKGNWTIPATGGIIGDSTGVHPVTDIPTVENDGFNGGTIATPSQARPLPYNKLTTVSGNRVVKIGQPLSMHISGVPPSTQVWIFERCLEDPNVVAGYCLGGYTGVTNSNGQYDWNTIVSGGGANWLGGHVYNVYVVNWTGPGSGTSIPESGNIGPAGVWIVDASGNPANPAMAALINQ